MYVSDLLSKAEHHPFMISPSTMQSLLQNLSSLDPKYVSMELNLFAKHLPAIRAPMMEEDLEAQIEADRKLQEELRRSGFGSGDQSKKRVHDDRSPMSSEQGQLLPPHSVAQGHHCHPANS